MKSLFYILICFFLSFSSNCISQNIHNQLFVYGYYGKTQAVNAYSTPNGKIYKKLYPHPSMGGYVFNLLNNISDGWVKVKVDSINLWIKNPMVYVYYGDSSIVYLYSEPKHQSKVLLKLNDNDPLIVIGYNENWINVKWKQKQKWFRGWIYKNNSDPSGI